MAPGQAVARRLPLAAPGPVLSLPDDVVYGLARIDPSGRLCERAVVGALGWSGGDLLTLTADAHPLESQSSFLWNPDGAKAGQSTTKGVPLSHPSTLGLCLGRLLPTDPGRYMPAARC